MSAPAIISSGTAAGGPPVGGTGTTNTIPRWTGVSTLGDSLITQTLAGAPFEATRIRVATGVDTYAWFRDSAPSGNVLFVAANAAFGAYKGLEIASAGTYFTVGYVGIGTTGPVRTLHVVATTAASPARLQNTVGSFELGFDASGAYIQPNTANTGVWLYTQAGSFFGIDANGNIYGTSGTTGMTKGFFYIPAAAGAPTGTPTAVSGRVPMYYDTTNNKFYVYNGAWKAVTLT